MTNIEYRPLNTTAEFHEAEDLQLKVWGGSEIETVPTHIMCPLKENGGVVYGAFTRVPAREDVLVGLVIGFPGISRSGVLIHCSDLLCVHPDYRNLDIGYQLKLIQRAFVLDQGINLITWTFDPLESRNANLNFHKLGGVSRIYLNNYYGNMKDNLNSALPSDRLLVEWWVATERVKGLVNGTNDRPMLDTKNWVILNPSSKGNFPRPAEDPQSPIGEPALVEIPGNFREILAADPGLAIAWRMHLGVLFKAIFSLGYQITDFVFSRDIQRGHYYLERLTR